MAKRIVKWVLDGSVLKLSKALEQEGSEAVIEAEFNLVEFFADYEAFSDAQKQAVAYAVKQKLMDVGANAVGDSDTKIQAAKKQWERLLAGEWKGERINATGASENKKLLAKVKEVSGTVTLQGLLIKKTVMPDQFTEEDEAKLQEFLQVLAKNQ